MSLITLEGEKKGEEGGVRRTEGVDGTQKGGGKLHSLRGLDFQRHVARCLS